MRNAGTRFITPEEDSSPYPYGRVFRSLIIQLAVGGLLLGAVYALFALFDFNLSGLSRSLLLLAVALTPLGSWAVFSWWPDRRVSEPRLRLPLVVAITALSAAAITWPLIERVLQPDVWLAQSSAITRIIGFSLAVGVPIEFTKYLVLRYTIWPASIRVRMDGLAYSIASSIGMATVFNLQALAVPGIEPGTLAIIAFDNTAIGIAAGLFVGYGLAETAIGRPNPFIGPLTLSLAALVHGLAIPLRTGLTSGGFSLAGGSASPALGVAISVGLVVVVSIGTSFLIAASERREREAEAADL